MENLPELLALAAVLVALCSLIAIIRPIGRIGLGSRKRAFGVLGLSFATFIVAAILGGQAREGEPNREPGTNLSKSVEGTWEAPTSPSSEHNASPGSETIASSPEKEPQPEPKPASAPEPEPAFVAHAYKTLEASNRSPGGRKRTRLRIHAPSATTPDTLIGTAMKAAVEAQVTHQSQFVIVFVHADDDPRSEILAQVRFAPDGCGISGEECTGEMWTSARSVVQVPTERQIAIFEAT